MVSVPGEDGAVFDDAEGRVGAAEIDGQCLHARFSIGISAPSASNRDPFRRDVVVLALVTQIPQSRVRVEVGETGCDAHAVRKAEVRAED
jgi:hypothetical protein